MSRASHSILVLAAVVLVFVQARYGPLRNLLGVQIDFLPPLMVYAGSRGDWTVLTTTALAGGLGYDTLSANPLGLTVVPLFLTGLAVRRCRDLILCEQRLAQFVLGLGASTVSPLLALLFLLTLGFDPLANWTTLGQWVILAIGGALATPGVFWFFEWVDYALNHPVGETSSFRPDREIERGPF